MGKQSRSWSAVVVSALLTSVSGVALSTGAAHAQSNAEDNQAFNIPAQELSSALSEYARQTNIQVLFAFEPLRGVQAPAVIGHYSREDALARLLAGSGFAASVERGGIVRLEQIARPQAASNDAAPNDTVANDANDEIIVTGSRIRGAAPSGANLIIIDRENIRETGRATVQDVIQTLPQNFAGSQNEATKEGTLNARSNFTFASTVDLRGLGADATLTLVNGRRLAPAGVGNYVDISAIPLSAVERIEVLADGASAVYGSDAVGGVVNIILDRNFEGAETGLRAGGATQGGAEDYGFSQLAGFSGDRANLVAGYEFRRRGDVDIMDRAFTETADYRDRGGNNFNRVQSNPGNITRIGATGVSLAIPRGQDGSSLSESDLIAGAANANLGEINIESWLMPRQESHALFLSGHWQVTSNLELFGDVVATRREAYSERANLPTNLTVPETNAWRVLNNLFPGRGPLTVAYHMTRDLGPQTTETESDAYTALAGAAFEFDNQWRLEGSFALAHSREDIVVGNIYDGSAIAPALASGNLATAFNPFGDGSHTDPAVLARLRFNQVAFTEGETRTYALKADGPLWTIWGGAVRAAFGVERRQEDFVYRRRQTQSSGAIVVPTQRPGAREVDAIFAELNAPLIGAGNGVPLARALTLSLSARREEASDYGAATTPKIGVDLEVVEGLRLRGSWGRSFKGPDFLQLLGGSGASYLTATPLQDPLADNGSTGVLAVAGSNPNLSPERAESWSAGIDVQPVWLPGFRASATYFDIDFADRISQPGAALTILRNPAGFEQLIFRDPSPELLASYLAIATPGGALPAEGVEVIIDQRFVNLSTQRVRGIDTSASYTFETGIGDISLNAAGSLLLQHEFTLAPGAVPVVQLDRLNGPIDWRARAGVSYRAGPYSAGFNINYADNYTDNISLPTRKVDAFRTYDLRLAHDWRGEDERGAILSLAVQNLLDADPPFVNNATGYAYDASNHSPLGRVVSLELRQSW